MAIPTIANNAPSAGHIQWGAFNIQLHGVTYSVGAGSSNQRWVWWKYNNGSPSIQGGADVPTTLVDDDLVLFGNKNGIGVRVQSTNFVDGELLVDGSIFAEALSTNLINSQHIVTAGLDAGVIKFGEMHGDRIAVNTLMGDRIIANTIGVSKLLVSDFNNYIADGDLSDPSLQNWVAGLSRFDPAGEQPYIQWASSTSNAHQPNQNWFEVKNGDEFVFTAEVSTPSENSGAVTYYPAIRVIDGDGTVLPWPQAGVGPIAPGTAWTPVEVSFKVTNPTSFRAVFDHFLNAAGVAGRLIRVRGMYLSKKVNGKLVVDGTIVGDHIASKTITAEEIAGETITANEIAARTITALQIVSRTLTANEIKADTITANELAANSVTASEIKAGEIQTGHLQAGAVTAEKVGADVIVANEVYTPRGYVGTLNADQIESGSIESTIAIVGSLSVGDISIAPETGITVPGPVGNTILSSDGSKFAGEIETGAATINGGLTLNGATNSVNGVLELLDVTQKPKVGPSVRYYRNRVTKLSQRVESLTEGLDNTSWVGVDDLSGTIKKFSKTTGVLQSTFTPPTGYIYVGVVKAKGYYYVASKNVSTSEIFLARISSSGGVYTQLQSIVTTSQYTYHNQMGMGVDSRTGNIMTAFGIRAGAANENKVQVDTWTGNSGTVATQRVSSVLFDNPNAAFGPSPQGRDVAAVGIVSSGPGNSAIMYLAYQYDVRIFDVATKAFIAEMYSAGGLTAGIAMSTNGKLAQLGSAENEVYEYESNTTWNDHDDSVVVDYSWYDSNTAGDGKHETEVFGTYKTSVWPRWHLLEVETPSPAYTGGVDSPDSVAIYIDGHRQSDLGSGVTKNSYAAYARSNISPKTTNEFASATVTKNPGQVRTAATFPSSSVRKFQLRGDGTGNWGNLTVDADGYASFSDTGWINVNNFELAWQNYGGAYAPASYRKIGRQVFLRGLVRGDVGVSGLMFTLPAGFRPLNTLILPAVVATFSKSFDAVGDNAKTVLSDTPNNSTASHRHNVPISAYDISTTVSMTNVAFRLSVNAAGEVTHGGGVDAAASPNWFSLDGIVFFID